MKNRIFGLLFCICFLGVMAPVHASIITGPVVNPANNHSYYLLDQATWSASETESISLGGHLVAINDSAENAWVVQEFLDFGGAQRNLWIGLTDSASEGTFAWTNGDSVGYTNWASGQPDDTFGNQDFALMISPQNPYHLPTNATKWDDGDGTLGVPVYGVAEVPEPGSITLFVGSISGLLVMRNRRRDLAK